VCLNSGSSQMPRYEVMYPQLQPKILPTREDVFVGLVGDNGCDTAILPKIYYDTFRTETKSCNTRIVENIVAEYAGWVTNQQSWCVQRAFEWAINGLEVKGEVKQLFMKWFPAASCRVPSSSHAGRRLEFWRAEDTDQFQESFVVSRGDSSRHLKGVSLNQPATDEGSGPGMAPVEILDFAGMYILWGGITALIVLVNRLEQWRFKVHFAPTRTATFDFPSETNGNERQQIPQQALSQSRGSQIGFRNDDAMMSEMLKHILEIKEHVKDTRDDQEELRRRQNCTSPLPQHLGDTAPSEKLTI